MAVPPVITEAHVSTQLMATLVIVYLVTLVATVKQVILINSKLKIQINNLFEVIASISFGCYALNYNKNDIQCFHLFF